MTLPRICLIFVGVLGIASLTATLAGRPELWWVLALVLGSGAASYLTRLDPLKGAALALMALRAGVVVLVDMALDFAETFRERYQGRWERSKGEMGDWD